MKVNFFRNYLQKKYKISPNLGFTLTELLTAALVGSMVISSLLWIMNDTLQANQDETIKRETSKNLKMALDYITEDLREAVYVYDGDELIDKLNYLPFSGNSKLTPILAFWKVENVPYNSSQSLPSDCNTIAATLKTECENLKLERKAPTLIVYLLSTDNSQNLWQGKSRIERYQLRKYSNISTLAKNTGYVDPLRDAASFQEWPKSGGGTNLQTSLPTLNNTNLLPLVDFIYVNDSNPSKLPALSSCITDTAPYPIGEVYKSSPQYNSAQANQYPRGFYTCISLQDTNPADGYADEKQDSNNREVKIFIQGSTDGKLSTSIPTMEMLQSQIITKGLYQKKSVD